MAGVARTISALTSAANSSSAVIQDIVATLANRTAYTRINIVTEPEFGADPTGANSSSAAFTSALSGGALAIVPPGTYKIGNIAVPSGSGIVGWSSGSYGNNYAVLGKTILIPDSSAQQTGTGAQNFILNVAGSSNIFLSGFDINCDNSSNSSGVQSTVWCGLSGGSNFLVADNISIRMALRTHLITQGFVAGLG